MAANEKTSRVRQLAADKKFIDGTKQFLMRFTSLPVGSRDVTPTEIVQVFEDLVAKTDAAVEAADARKAAIKAERDARKQAAPFVDAFKRIVLGMFLQSPDTLGVFGLRPPRVGRRTAAEKAAAAEKVVATKKARGPIGRRQRAKVKAAPAPAATAPKAGV
jgi:hypothetical protein